MNTNHLLSMLKELVDNNKRTIEYGDEVIDAGYIYKFIEEQND